MTKPFIVDMPHKLGRDEAKRRMRDGIGKLPEHIPGGAAKVDSRWEGDRLHLNVLALGQTVSGTLDVHETKVHVELLLPPMLQIMAGPLEKYLRSKGGEMLEDKSGKSA